MLKDPPVFCRLFLVVVLAFLSYTKVYSQELDQWKKELENTDPTVRIEALHQLTSAYSQINLDTALIYARQAVAASQELKHDSLLTFSYKHLVLVFYYASDQDSLIFYANKGISANKSLKDPLKESYFCRMKSYAYRDKGDNNKAIEAVNSALELCIEAKDDACMASMYSSKGSLFQGEGVYDTALFYFIKASDIFERVGSHKDQSISYAQIGDLYLDMKDLKNGLYYTKKALALTDSKKDIIHYGDLLNGIGTIYNQDSSKIDSAIHYFTLSKELFEKINDEEGMLIAYGNLGNAFSKTKNWDKAFEHYFKAREIQEKRKYNLAYLYKNIAFAHEQTQQLDSASYYYQKTVNHLEEELSPFYKEEILNTLYKFYKKEGATQKALDYYEQLTALQNQTKSEAVQKEMLALQTQYETEKKERTIERLELQASVDASKQESLIVGILGLSVSAVLLVLGILYRRRNEQKVFQIKQALHEEEKNKLDQELSYKTKQLTSHALHMVQKNKVLQELKKEIGSLSKEMDSQHKKALKTLSKRIDFNLQSDEDWDTFKLYFEQTNQNFYTNLAGVNKDLTTAELRLCSLIKLNLNIKETASVLSIEPTSVKTARHRLRKKLNLEQGEDLSSFIRQLS